VRSVRANAGHVRAPMLARPRTISMAALGATRVRVRATFPAKRTAVLIIRTEGRRDDGSEELAHATRRRAN